MMGDLALNLVKVAAVFALLYVTLRLLGTWQRQRGVARPSGGRARPRLVEKLEELRIGRAASIVTVRVGDTVLLLGVTEQRIEQLADVTESVDLASLDEDVPTSGPTPFEHALALLRQRSGQ